MADFDTGSNSFDTMGDETAQTLAQTKVKKKRKPKTLDRNKPCWVYTVMLNGTDKTYVGITNCIKVETRWKAEKREAARGDRKHFYEALRKYGPDAFDWCVLCQCENREDAIRAERTYIAAGWTHYNKTPGGDGQPPGYCPTEETRAKLSRALKGKKKPPMREEQKQLLRELNTGKTISPEARQKISDALSGRPAHNKGEKHSEETCKKMSELMIARYDRIGRVVKPETVVSGSAEHHAKISKALTGVKQDPARVAARTITLMKTLARKQEIKDLLLAMGPVITEVHLDG